MNGPENQVHFLLVPYQTLAGKIPPDLLEAFSPNFIIEFVFVRARAFISVVLYKKHRLL